MNTISDAYHLVDVVLNGTASVHLCSESSLTDLAEDVKAVDCCSSSIVVDNVNARVILMQMLLSRWILVKSIEGALGQEFMPTQVFMTVYLKLNASQLQLLEDHESKNLKSKTTPGQKESVSILATGKLGAVSPYETIEEMESRSPKVKVLF